MRKQELQLERARQFIPFMALKGFWEMVQQAQKQREQRRELSEERVRQLQELLAGLQRGDCLQVEYYSGGRYVIRTGRFCYLDAAQRLLVLADARIPLAAVSDLSLVFGGSGSGLL